MYETEANLRSESASQIPSEVLSALGETKGKVTSRTLISWGEHCTECGWPTCYTTCELYEPREDLKCRRFVDGMVRVDCAESLTNYLLKISFKRWGMLWARGNFQLHPLASADRLEQRDYRIGTVLQQLPFSAGARRQFVEKRYSFKKRLASRALRMAIVQPVFCWNATIPNPKLSGFLCEFVRFTAAIPSRIWFNLRPAFATRENSKKLRSRLRL